MPEIDTGDVRISYNMVGTGDPVLLLHGGMASTEFWRRAGYVDALAANHRLVLVDFRGHGASSRPHDPATYGLLRDVADTLAVLDAENLAAATICGWSWGGLAGLAMAALHPERVRSVLAIGASGRRSARFSDVPSDFSRFTEIAARIGSEGMPGTAAELERMGGQRWLHDEMLRNDPTAIAAWYTGQVSAPPIGAALADVKPPILFVAGELELPLLNFPDRLVPAHARLQVIPGANHVSAFLRVDQVVPALEELIAGDRLAVG